MQLLAGLSGFDWQGTAKAVNAQLAAMNPPLALSDFDPVKYNQMYPDVASKYPDTATAWDQQSPKNIGSYKKPIDHYLQYGIGEGRTLTLTDAAQARALAAQFAYADFVAAKALQAAGVTGANFDSAAYTAAHQGDPQWYASWSPWQFYIYYGLAAGYPFPVLGAGSTIIPTTSTTAQTATTTAANPSGSVVVQSGLTPWMTWLVSQVPSMQGVAITTDQALGYANQYATLPVSSSAVLPASLPNYNGAALPTSNYSPYQTNYAVSPGIPDTGVPGIPGTGTGAPSAPLTYDQVTAATNAAAAPKLQAGIGWVAAAGLGAWYLYQHSKKKGRSRAVHHASTH